MESKTKRYIKPGREYDRFFPLSGLVKTTIKGHARLEDTIQFIPKGVEMTLYQTSRIAPQLVGSTPYETCRKVWYFAFDHIAYRKDEPGKEQIQSPQYTWAARAGDCDDYTVLIASILRNLGFTVILRVAMYDEEIGYQHIYPVAVLPDGKKVIMDCVAERFDYEVPYIKKIDKTMELQFLNGIPKMPSNNNQSIDAQDLLDGYDDLGDLGKGKLKAKLQKAGNKIKNSKFGQKVKATGNKIKNSKAMQKVKKGFHAINRVNPATALLRAGILLGMKMNMFKIAEKLRYSYLSPEQAQAKGIDMAKYPKLVSTRQRLDKIFYGAGGKPENLKSAILKGRGNRDRQVAGLGAVDQNEYTLSDSPVTILGIEAYNAEIGAVEGLGELGIATEAAIAAATSVLAAIAGVIKGIGDIKKKKAAAPSDSGQNQGGESSSGGGGGGSSSASDNSGESDNSSGGDNSGEQSSEEQPSGEESSTDGTESESDRGGAGNESYAETPPTASKQEGSEDDQGNVQDESADNGSGQNSSGSEDSADSGASDAEMGITPKDNVFVRTVNWVRQNPKKAALGTLVIGGVIYGLAKAFSPSQKPKTKQQLAGLPKGKGKKKHNRHHPGRLKFLRLK